MPRFYGDRMDVIIDENMTLEDAMCIKNNSLGSELADFGSEYISDSQIDIIFASLSEEDKVAEIR